MTETLSAPAVDILERIRYQPSGLNPIEARIASAILEDPERVVRESITSFAGRTAVSAGSVVRFAKTLGLDGYRELKLALATSVVQEGPRRTALPASSRFRDYMDQQIRATIYAAEEIQPMTMEAAAAAIAGARRVDITATGSSAIAAQSLVFSLTLLGLHTRFLPDAAEQAAAAAFLGPRDCLIAVSFSGRTRAIVNAAARASRAGATVIVLTCSARSALLRHANVALLIDAQKGKFNTEWPLRAAMVAVSRALTMYVADHLTEEELRSRRATWSSGRFGLRAEEPPAVAITT